MQNLYVREGCETFSQNGQKALIDLHSDDFAGLLSELFREHAQSRPDLEDMILGGEFSGLDDLVEYVFVAQKVLAPALAGVDPMALQEFPRYSRRS
jgi:hypothetical protein